MHRQMLILTHSFLTQPSTLLYHPRGLKNYFFSFQFLFSAITISNQNLFCILFPFLLILLEHYIYFSNLLFSLTLAPKIVHILISVEYCCYYASHIRQLLFLMSCSPFTILLQAYKIAILSDVCSRACVFTLFCQFTYFQIRI